jgi:hypothetical protein
MESAMLVRGFHGTSQDLARSILAIGFHVSRNDYDWLGDGIYFFQDAPQRAWEWAEERFGHSAAVLAADILLEDCMDLLDRLWFHVLSDSYDAFLAHLKEAGREPPVQTRGAHRLDRAVINYVVGILAEQGVRVRSVRAAFAEGSPVYPKSALFDKAHIQIAVRDPALIRNVSMEAKR